MYIFKHSVTIKPIIVGNILLIALVLFIALLSNINMYKEVILIWLIISISYINYSVFFSPKALVKHVSFPKIDCRDMVVINSESINKKGTKEIKEANKIAETTKAPEYPELLQSAFLANLSHEIRTPMNSILGFSQLLENEEITSDMRKEYVEIINKNSNCLLQVIDDVLSIAKIESGKLKPKETKGSVSGLLHDIYESFTAENAIANLSDVKFIIKNKLTLDLDIIISDFLKLKQVINNLVNNAFKFTRKGFVELGCKPLGKGVLLFYVKDTGIGIPGEKHQSVFLPFCQGEDSFLTKEYQGLGLGLTISKRLIEFMKGEIWIESEIGQGTTFFFTIPFKQA